MVTGRVVALVSLSLVMGVVATLATFQVSVLLYSFFQDPQAGFSLRLFNTCAIGVWLLWLWLFITPRGLPRSIAVWINLAFPLALGIIFQSEFPRIFEGGLLVSSSLVSYNALVRWKIFFS